MTDLVGDRLELYNAFYRFCSTLAITCDSTEFTPAVDNQPDKLTIEFHIKLGQHTPIHGMTESVQTMLGYFPAYYMPTHFRSYNKIYVGKSTVFKKGLAIGIEKSYLVDKK